MTTLMGKAKTHINTHLDTSWETILPILHIPGVLCFSLHSSIIIHYIAKSIGSPPSNERFDYFSNFHEYNVLAYNDILENCVLLIL